MFIGICGSICAGKSTVAQYLVEHHGFKRLRVLPAANGITSSDGQQQLADGNSHQPDRPAAASRTLHFSNSTGLLDFVTKRWRERWVILVEDANLLDLLAKRPFFLLISVDAPVTVRWKRHQQHQEQHHEQPASRPNELAEFVERSDAHLYGADTGHMALMARATVRLLNTSSDVAHLFATLAKVDLPNEDRLRPTWDAYFMSLASLAAQRSNCMKRRVGCVLIREKRVVATGYNGTPRGIRNCGEGGCARCNDGSGSGVGLATCLCLHAEENALLEAGRDRIRDGSILYCDTCPCLTCSIKIAQVGIGEVVYSQGYSMDTETAAVLREAGVKLRQFVPPPNGLIHLEKSELY